VRVANNTVKVQHVQLSDMFIVW